MNRLLEVPDMDRRIFRGITVTGICNVLSGRSGIVGPVNYSLSPGVVMSTGCASRFTLIPAAIVIGIVGLSPAAIAFLGGVPSVIVGCVMSTSSHPKLRLGYWWRIRIEYFSLKMDWSSACQCSSGQSSRSFLPMCWQHFLSFSGRFWNGFVVGTVGAFLLDRTMFGMTVPWSLVSTTSGLGRSCSGKAAWRLASATSIMTSWLPTPGWLPKWNVA